MPNLKDFPPDQIQKLLANSFNLRGPCSPFIPIAIPLAPVLHPALPPQMGGLLTRPPMPAPIFFQQGQRSRFPLRPPIAGSPAPLLHHPFLPPPTPAFVQLHGHHPPPDIDRLRDMLTARLEAEQPHSQQFDPYLGSWMSPREQILILQYQMRSISAGNPYVEVGKNLYSCC